MTQKSANSCSSNDPSRCQKRLANGTRCRSLALDIDSGLCPHHAKLHQKHQETADVAALLIGHLTEFSSATDINKVLSQLLILLAQNRIAPRRAAVMAYTCNLLLRTLPAIDHENNSLPEEDAASIILRSVPLPIRDEHPTRRASPACPGPLGESHRDEPGKPS